MRPVRAGARHDARRGLLSQALVLPAVPGEREEKLSSISQQYVELWRDRVKGWHPTPSRLETAAYLVTEAAEALDAVLRMEQPDHDRTNGHHVKAGLEREIGQIMDMTLTLANLYGIDAHGAMYAWMGEVEDRSLAKVAERNGNQNQRP